MAVLLHPPPLSAPQRLVRRLVLVQVQVQAQVQVQVQVHQQNQQAATVQGPVPVPRVQALMARATAA